MATNLSSRPSRRNPPGGLSYWDVSRRPLQILAFLLPLILAYELGLALLLQSEDGRVLSNVAHVTLLSFFKTLGIEALSGMYLGGVAIVVVLLVWHVLLRERWVIDGRALGAMAAESLVLTLPLIVLGMLLTRSAPSVAAVSMELSASDLAQLDLPTRMVISIGAGLYEELMFRMLLIALVHTLLVDVGKLSFGVGAAVAVAVSAAAFTWYHPLADASGQLSYQNLVFYFLAGLYFGAIYVFRGFGIVVGVHALYDIIIMASMPMTNQM